MEEPFSRVSFKFELMKPIPPFDPLRMGDPHTPRTRSPGQLLALEAVYWRVARHWIRGGFPETVGHHTLSPHGQTHEALLRLQSKFPEPKTEVPTKNRDLTPHLQHPFDALKIRTLAQAERHTDDPQVKAFDLAVYQTAHNLGTALHPYDMPTTGLRWPSLQRLYEIDLAFAEEFEGTIHRIGRKLMAFRAIADLLDCSMTEAIELYKEALNKFTVIAHMSQEEAKVITESIALQAAATSSNPVPAIAAIQRSQDIGKQTTAGPEDFIQALIRSSKEAQKKALPQPEEPNHD